MAIDPGVLVENCAETCPKPLTTTRVEIACNEDDRVGVVPMAVTTSSSGHGTSPSSGIADSLPPAQESQASESRRDGVLLDRLAALLGDLATSFSLARPAGARGRAAGRRVLRRRHLGGTSL